MDTTWRPPTSPPLDVEESASTSTSKKFSSASISVVESTVPTTITSPLEARAVKKKPATDMSMQQRILQDRSSHEIYRDTKRILEICYGKTPPPNNDVTEGTTTTSDTVKKPKKKKKSTTTKKAMKKPGDGDTSAAATTATTTTTTTTTTDKVISEGKNADPLKKRKKKKKKKVASKTGDGYDAGADGDEDTEGDPVKKRKKKKKKSKTKKKPVERDAAGRVVRKRRKIKDRHKVVRKQFIKKGKDAKIDLPTITEDDFDEDGEEFEDEDSVSDSNDESSSDDDEEEEGGGDIVEGEEEEHAYYSDEDDEYHDGWEEAEHDSTENDSQATPTVSNVRKGPIDLDKFQDELDEAVRPPAVVVGLKDVDIEAQDDEATSVLKATIRASGGSSSTDSTNENDAGAEKKSNKVRRNYTMIFCSGIFIVGAVAAAVVLVIFFVFIPGESDGSASDFGNFPTLAPQSPPSLSLTSSPTSIPATAAPTISFSEVSTTCQTLDGRPGVQVFEAGGTMSTLRGNLTRSNEASGYCGSGYITNFDNPRSRLLFSDVELSTSGFYTLVLRYSIDADATDEEDLDDDTFEYPQLIVDVDGTAVGAFTLFPTGNSTTWMVDEVQDVLLQQGTHRLVIWTPGISGADGTNVDWLALQLEKPASRFEYLTSILTPVLPEVAEPSPVQIEALLWMSSDDPADWSKLDGTELIERYALVLLFFSTQGDLWFNRNEWLSELHVCNWYGVACWDDNKVADLILDENGLLGKLPSDLFLLKELVSLSFTANSLDGTIGTDVGKMGRLERLLLDTNFLTGTIPAEIASLEALEYLSLDSNSLSGEIPIEIFSLSELEFLSVASNSLNGTLSTSIGENLQSLRDLDLQSNQLSGELPSEVGLLTSLTSLSLAFNAFLGTVPSELGLLTLLTLLDINSNQLTGVWPPELNLLNNTIIDFYGNDIVA